MLSCAVLGNVFASPAVTAILAGIKCVAGPHGVLIIVKNYTGDRLNFGMAMEKAKLDGIKAMMVIVEDDCALQKGKGITGGRGIAGTVLVHKIAGAVAATGATLEEVHRVASTAAGRIASLGVALSTCTVPGTPSSTRLNAPGLFEVGMGIHGESGREQRMLPADSAAKAVAELLVDGILSSFEGDDLKEGGAQVAVLLNNLGALPVIEQLVLANDVLQRLQQRGVVVARAYVGSFMTALEMNGASLSLLRLTPSLLALLDDPCSASAWTRSCDLLQPAPPLDCPSLDSAAPSSYPLDGATVGSKGFGLLEGVCRKLQEMEPQLTEMDLICGDGDCGVVLQKGAVAVLKALPVNGEDCSRAEFCERIASAVSSSMGGTSGALLELCFRAMCAYFAQGTASEDHLQGWALALQAGVDAIKFYGGADVGMRTMLDALVPAVAVLVAGPARDDESVQELLLRAAQAAASGRDLTAHMGSLAGRANYVAAERMQGVPDPGAAAVAGVFQQLADSFPLC
mmetsp:Transcript_21554/g.30882  ORF Transcript_21554/g.30882 Transcript_21554/m.30882 type:complete len:514 (+) Transcript_21554:235-1776(+)